MANIAPYIQIHQNIKIDKDYYSTNLKLFLRKLGQGNYMIIWRLFFSVLSRSVFSWRVFACECFFYHGTLKMRFFLLGRVRISSPRGAPYTQTRGKRRFAALPTRANHVRKTWTVSSVCFRCSGAAATRIHLSIHAVSIYYNFFGSEVFPKLKFAQTILSLTRCL